MKMRRGQTLEVFGQVPSCVVAMEACGRAFPGGEIGKPGHDVRLIPPVYVKPFLRRQKNGAADGETICKAQHPRMLTSVQIDATRPAAPGARRPGGRRSGLTGLRRARRRVRRWPRIPRPRRERQPGR